MTLTSEAVTRAKAHRYWDSNLVEVLVDFSRGLAKPYGCIPCRYWDYISRALEQWVTTIKSRRECTRLKLERYDEKEREAILDLVETKLGHVGHEGQIALFGSGRRDNDCFVDASSKGATRHERLVFLKDKIDYEMWLILHISKFEDMYVEEEIRKWRHMFGLCNTVEDVEEDYNCLRCRIGCPKGVWIAW